jgi:hypothetical protein
MRKTLAMLVALGVLFGVMATAATAGSPHFIKGAFQVSTSGNTLTVSGKEAGLGDEAQVDIVLSATAECVNGGGNHPKAANKESVSASGLFPVQNGEALFTLAVTASFQPDCSPPMQVVYTNISITDLTDGITVNL